MENKIIKKTIRYPSIRDYGGDKNKDWYVAYAVINPLTNKMKEFRIFGNANQFKTKKERYKILQEIVVKTKRKLESGWTPYNDENSKYESVLNYADKGKKHIPEIKYKDYTAIQFLNEALVSKQKYLRLKSFQSTQSKLRRFENFLKTEELESIGINDIDKKLAQKFLDYLHEDGLHNKTRKSYRTALGSLFNTDIIKDITEVNPFKQTKPIKAETTENKRPFRKNEIERIKAYCLKNEPEIWFFIQFIFYCFIRPGELRHLKVNDFNFEDSTILIRPEISKNGKKQSVIMPNHFASEVFEKLKNKANKDYIFPSLQKIKQILDRPRSKSYFGNKFRAILNELGFGYDVSLYSWKHTGAVYFYKKTKDMHALKEQLRHHSLEMVQIYLKCHLNINDDVLRKDFPEL